MPNDQSVGNCLRNLGSCPEHVKDRLRAAGLIDTTKITPLGYRLLAGACTDKDLEEMQERVSSWYRYSCVRSVLKSPIDCGDK